ncbi:MAG: M23 family metallopeptidase [Gemmatimonadetes bacterium]|nr:M23 family metallopeptidase [Gemmatimonadota bacterium]
MPERMRARFIAFIFFLLLTVVEGGAEPFGWPIPLQPALSSTFGETRSTAFHAGIDVKTWGRTGYEVRALQDGYIWRLRTSPWGYGRVVYQKLADGRILVYAHLQGFAPKLAERIEAAQQEKGFYSVDLWFAKEELPIAKGELIAWTGQSGAGPPHLHLELRDADSRPLNPLLHGFGIEDGETPTVRRIGLIPVGRESRVNGEHRPISFELRWNEKKQVFESGKVAVVQGRVGVAVLTYDRADRAPNKLAPYRTSLRIDGEELFATHYDRYSYDNAHQVELDRTRLEVTGKSSPFFNLFRLPGNRLGFYGEKSGDGLLLCGVEGALEKGRRQIEVDVADVAGNVSRARFQVEVNAFPEVIEARLSEDGRTLVAEVRDADDAELEVELALSKDGMKWKKVDGKKVGPGRGTWKLKERAALWRVTARDKSGSEAFRTCATSTTGGKGNGPQLAIGREVHEDFVELIVEADQVLAEAPAIRSAGRSLAVRQMELLEFRSDVPLEPDGAALLEVEVGERGREGVNLRERVFLDQRSVQPGEERVLVFGGGDVELLFAANSAYSPFFPQVERFHPHDAEQLTSGGIGCDLSPATVRFDHKVEVRLRYPEGLTDAEKLGLYVQGGDGSWSLAGNELDAERRTVGARVRQFSRFALMIDKTPPTIDGLRPASGTTIERQRPRLSARIDDGGSGIGREEDIEMILDGRRLISVYDPEGKRVEYLLRENLTPGEHELVVTVRDMGGNEATVRSAFSVK